MSLALRELRKEDLEFQAILSYIANGETQSQSSLRLASWGQASSGWISSLDIEKRSLEERVVAGVEMWESKGTGCGDGDHKESIQWA